ncbi:hypothetical protein FOL47_005634, partial [Perkinsus chesapeaki]
MTIGQTEPTDAVPANDRSENSGWFIALKALHARVLDSLQSKEEARRPRLPSV